MYFVFVKNCPRPNILVYRLRVKLMLSKSDCNLLYLFHVSVCIFVYFLGKFWRSNRVGKILSCL